MGLVWSVPLSFKGNDREWPKKRGGKRIVAGGSKKVFGEGFYAKFTVCFPPPEFSSFCCSLKAYHALSQVRATSPTASSILPVPGTGLSSSLEQAAGSSVHQIPSICAGEVRRVCAGRRHTVMVFRRFWRPGCWSGSFR